MKKNTFGLRSGLALLLAVSILLSLAPGWAFAQRAGTEEAEELPSASVKSAPQTVSTQDIDSLLEQIGSLPEAAALGEYYDHTVHKATNSSALSNSVNGTFFLVNVLTGKDGKPYAFAMDPTMPSTYGHLPAVPVTLTGTNASGLPTAGTTLSGVTEGMAITISSPTNNKWHTLQLRGPYDKMDEDFFIHGRVYNGSKTMMTLYPETGNGSFTQGDGSYVIALDDRDVNGSRRVSFTYQGPKESNGADYYHYIGLSTSDPEDPDIKYFLTTNVSAPVGGTDYKSFSQYYTQSGNPTLEQVDSYLFRLLSDRVDTSDLYQALTSLTEVLTWDERYDPETYEALTVRAREALELYVSYNGKSFSTGALPGAEEEIYRATRDLTNLSAALKVNKSTDNGISISHFNANMYRWDELGMNNITRQKDPTGKKGFYFSDAPGDGANNKNYSYFSRFISDDAYRQVLEFDGVKYSQVLQNFSIYSGLSLPKLTDDGLPQADTDQIVVPDLWSPTDLTDADGTELRKVYSNVSVPFMYDPETGYYTLSSNSNAVFFEGEPVSGATLQISDKPALINTGYGSYETTGYSNLGGGTTELGKVDTYDLYDSYSTAFQPFATMTNKEWKGFISISPMTFQPKIPEDGYLLDGITYKDTYTYGEMGDPAYGMGMVLEVKFNMTEDGFLEGDPITFNFGGDDDVWVYIDDELVLDIGGVHSAMQGSIDFSSGTVTVWNERFNRVVDIAGGDYTKRTDLYEFDTNIEQTLNGVTYGSAIKDLSIITAMDETGLYPRLYQKNLYTGEADNVAASAELIKAFSQEGIHTMKIFYMDRGRSRTNCYISFNLPQPDKLVVDKEISRTYGQMVDGTLIHTTEALSSNWMNTLENETYSFVLLENGQPCADVSYKIMEGSYRVASGKTGADGSFTMTAKQQVVFENLDFNQNKHYTVEESLTDQWGTPSYSFSYKGAENSIEGVGNGYVPESGDPYISETLTIRCTNTWCGSDLKGEPQKVVLDYAKPVDIEVVRNAVVDGASELIVREAELLNATLSPEDMGYGEVSAYLDLIKDIQGKTDGRYDSLRFTPAKMLDRVITLNCVIRLTFETGETRQVVIPVYIMPATQVYYETDFLRDTSKDLSLDVVGSKAESQPWVTEGSSQEEQQDNGYVTDRLDDFVIHRENIPSDAFFADFDGDSERYFSHPIYDGMDFDSSANWAYHDERMSKPVIDTDFGTMTMNMIAAGSGIRPYVQTGTNVLQNFHLNFHPGEDYYAQARFKLENLKLEDESSASHFMIHYYTGVDKYTLVDVNQGSTVDTIQKDLGSIAIPATAFTSGEYVTVSFKLNQIPYTRITALRFFFSNVISKSAEELGKITVDYFYIGPLTDKLSQPGQDLDADVRQELFFDFDNSKQAQLRYQQSQYNYNLKGKEAYRNFDTVKPRSTDAATVEGTWWTSHNNASEISINNTKGTLTIDVTNSAGTTAGRPYGPYLGTTSTHHGVTWANTESIPYHSLDFTPQGETWFYIRFKLTGCAEDTANSKEDTLGNNKLYLQFSVIDKNGKGYWVYPNYTLKNGEYITIACDVTDKVNECLAVSSIRSLYFRFTHLKQAGTAKGSIEVDYIYVGPKKAEANTHQDILTAIRSPEVRNLYIDFTNSINDSYRYSSQLYGGKNFDLAENWPTKYLLTPQVENGALKLLPTADMLAKEDGWGDLCTPTGQAISAPLQYYLSGENDILRFRAKFVGAKQKGSHNMIIGFGFGWTESTVAWDTDMARYAQDIDLSLIGDSWVEYTIELGDLYRNHSKYITHIFPYFSGVQFEADGYLLIDYIYMGPAEEFEAPITPAEENAVLIHFDNTDGDKKRYASSLYSGVNHDLDSSWYSDEDWFDPEVTNGKLVLTAKDKQDTKIDGYGSVKVGANLHYKMTGNDYIQVRFRIDGAKEFEEFNGSNSPKLRFFFGQTDTPSVQEFDIDREFRASEVVDKGWVTYTFDISSYAEQMEYLSFLFPSFYYLRSKDLNNRATYTIDYIYIGPLTESRPVSDSLFFGFDDMNMDRQRYSNSPYDGYNYDQGNWATSPEQNDGSSDYTIFSDAGSLHLSVTDKENVEGIAGPYLITTNKNGTYSFSEGRRSLSYIPEKAQYVQVRFRLNGCQQAAGKQANVVFLYGGYNKDHQYVRYNDESAVSIRGYFTPSEGYQTLTIPINEDIRKFQSFTNLGLRFQNILSTEGGSVDIDYIYVGPGELAPDPVYGYDSSYTDDDTLSNGSSWVVEGSGVKVNDKTQDYTQAQFSFRGTGFDLISCTGPEQATIRVQIWKEGAQKATKTLTVNNKGELDLYQIPVVSVEGLEYGNYTVTVWVNKAITNSAVEELNRGGQFFFDAVRIYEPMGPDYDANTLFADAYKGDKEAYPHVKEIRNILLSAENFAQLMGEGNGALFIDAHKPTQEDAPATGEDGSSTEGSGTTPGIALDSHYVADVQTYSKLGPKNEVYLAPRQAVAFRLDISTSYIPTSVDIGVKNIAPGEEGMFAAGVVSKDSTADNLNISYRRDIKIGSAAAQYYELKITPDNLFTQTVDGKTLRYCYIVLYNDSQTDITHDPGEGDGEHILSLTDVKVAYEQAPEEGLPKDQLTDPEIRSIPKREITDTYFDFTVDGQTLEAAALFMRAVLETPVLVEGTKIGHSLNLASDISINYVVPQAELAGYDSFCLQCLIPVYGRKGVEGSTKVCIEAVERNGYYYFTLEGLTALQMNDVIEATLHMEKDGRLYYSEPDFYSIAQYAYTQLGKADISARMESLCLELLRYGSAAQVYKGYRTDALADGAMTQEQKALLTDLSAVAFGTTNRQRQDLSAPTAKWVGKSLILDSNVTLRYVVNLSAYEDVLDTITVRICYTDYRGTEQTVTLTEARPHSAAQGCYSFDLDCLPAAELRTVIYAAVYAGDTQISNTLEYSMDTYGANKTGTLDTLCRALMAYSDSAKAYFAATKP